MASRRGPPSGPTSSQVEDDLQQELQSKFKLGLGEHLHHRVAMGD